MEFRECAPDPSAYHARVLLWALVLAAPLLRVDWDAAPGCPSREDFIRRVEAESDLRVEDAAAPVLTAEVAIRPLDDARWRLTMLLRPGGSVDEPTDERRLEADTCDAVVEAAALVVSMRIVELAPQSGPEREPQLVPELTPDPSGPRREPERRSTRDDRTALPREAQDEAPPPLLEDPEIGSRASAERREAPQPRDLGGWLGAQGGLALGVLPGVGGAVGLEGGLEGDHWRAGVAIHGAPVRRAEHPQAHAVRGRFDLVAAEVIGCGVPSVKRVGFPLCGRFSAGGIRGVGAGDVALPTPRWVDWLGLGGSVGVSWRITRNVAPVFAAEALASLRRPSFSVGSRPGTLYRTGPVAFRAWLGIEIHL